MMLNKIYSEVLRPKIQEMFYSNNLAAIYHFCVDVALSNKQSIKIIIKIIKNHMLQGGYVRQYYNAIHISFLFHFLYEMHHSTYPKFLIKVDLYCMTYNVPFIFIVNWHEYARHICHWTESKQIINYHLIM